MSEITDLELSYIAGFFDGEGCVSSNIPKDKTFLNLHLIFTNTDKQILLWIQSKIGGELYLRSSAPKRKASYNLMLQGIDACNLVNLLYPYVKIKNRQLDIAKIYFATKGNRTHQVNIALDTRLKELNKRGIDV